MNKTLIIIILSILLVATLYFVYQDHYADVGKMINYKRERDSLMQRFRDIQYVYETKEKQLTVLEAELLTEKSKVKRSEQKLSELLKRERHAQIENKRLIEKYNNNQLDSAFMAMYPRPDSVHR